MKVGLLTNLLSVQGGGVAEAVGRLGLALDPFCDVVTFGCGDGTPWVERRGRCVAFEAVGPARAGYSPHLWPEIRAAGLELLHIGGLWTYDSVLGLRWGRSKPYIVSPHGMLLPAARRYRWWKKQIGWNLWEKRFCQRAALLHATSEAELAHLRYVGLKQPIAVVPNGVSDPEPVMESRQRPMHRTALFLARIHPIKGLLNLVEAWARVQPGGWRLRIVGEDWHGYSALVESRVKELGIVGSVAVCGPKYGIEKWREYRSAELYILPSESENFAITVAEALRVGTPVITTRRTPWAEVVDRGCGWCVEYGIEELVVALEEATRLSDSERRHMGERGSEYVLERCSWDQTAFQMNSVYRWVLGQGVKPDFVHEI